MTAPGAHRFAVRVHYEDTDMGGIVYHANYLKFIERARSDWIRQLGIDQNAMRTNGRLFVVHRIESDFLAPARMEDELQVKTMIRRLTPVRMVLGQRVRRGDTAIFSALVTAVCMTLEGSPVRLPAEIRALVT